MSTTINVDAALQAVSALLRGNDRESLNATQRNGLRDMVHVLQGDGNVDYRLVKAVIDESPESIYTAGLVNEWRLLLACAFRYAVLDHDMVADPAALKAKVTAATFTAPEPTDAEAAALKHMLGVAIMQNHTISQFLPVDDASIILQRLRLGNFAQRSATVKIAYCAAMVVSRSIEAMTTEQLTLSTQERFPNATEIFSLINSGEDGLPGAQLTSSLVMIAYGELTEAVKRLWHQIGDAQGRAGEAAATRNARWMKYCIGTLLIMSRDANLNARGTAISEATTSAVTIGRLDHDALRRVVVDHLGFALQTLKLDVLYALFGCFPPESDVRCGIVFSDDAVSVDGGHLRRFKAFTNSRNKTAHTGDCNEELPPATHLKTVLRIFHQLRAYANRVAGAQVL